MCFKRLLPKYDEGNGDIKMKIVIVYTDVKRKYFENEDDFITEENADIYANNMAQPTYPN